jgi:hypothetical protein
MEGEGFEMIGCNCDPRFLTPPGGVKLQSVFVQTIPDVTLQELNRPPVVRHLCTIFNWIGMSGVATVAHGQEGYTMRLPMPANGSEFRDYTSVISEERWFKAFMGL